MTTTASLRASVSNLRAEAAAPAPTLDDIAAKHGNAPRPSLNRRPPQAPRTNTYPGYCTSCGAWVQAGEGLLGPKVNGKWTVKHQDDCQQVPASEPRTAGRVTEGRTETRPNPHPGIYTVESAEGHTTFRIYLQGEDEEFAPGELLLQRLTGRDNTGDYTTVAFVNNGRFNLFKRLRHQAGEQWVKDAYTLFRDPEAVLTAKHCIRCNRILTTPESIEAGIGPVCETL